MKLLVSLLTCHWTTEVKPFDPVYFFISHHHLQSIGFLLFWQMWGAAQVEGNKAELNITGPGSHPVQWPLDGGQTVTGQTSYFYMVRRNCLFVSTFHRSDMKLPQHRKCPIIHPSSTWYTKKVKRITGSGFAVKSLCVYVYLTLQRMGRTKTHVLIIYFVLLRHRRKWPEYTCQQSCTSHVRP